MDEETPIISPSDQNETQRGLESNNSTWNPNRDFQIGDTSTPFQLNRSESSWSGFDPQFSDISHHNYLSENTRIEQRRRVRPQGTLEDIVEDN